MDNDVHMSFTDMSDSAPWRSTWLASVPWTIEPHFASLCGFKLSMVVPDMLHCLNLGVARDALGSALKILLQERVVWDAPRLEDRMNLATESLRQFARVNKYHLRMKRFTRNRLTWKANRYPELVCSGYDSFVISSWLEGILENHADRYPMILTLLWSCNKATSLMYAASGFLTPEEKASLKVLGNLFLKTFLHLACQARQDLKFFWRVRPKLHLLAHVFDSCRDVNQSRYSTWMDEDYLKKIGRTLKLSPMRGAQQRLLQRWLLCLPGHFKQHLPKPTRGGKPRRW